MNITLVCQGFETSSLNLQPWRRVCEICKRMASEKFVITVVTDREGSSPKEINDKIKIVRSDLILSPFLKRKQLISALLETKPDIIVWYGTPFSIFYLNRLKALKRPLLLDIDTDFYGLRTLLKLPLREVRAQKLLHYYLTAVFSKWITRAMAKSVLVKQIIVPNTYLHDKLIHKGVAKNKITIVPSTVEEIDVEKRSQLLDEFRGKSGLNGNDFTILFFGAPTPVRGADVAIKSLKKVLSEKRSSKLLILSRRKLDATSDEDKYNKAEEKRLEALIEKYQVGENAQIISGYLDPSILRQYIMCSDCIVLPFRIVPSEPPLSIFEVMKMGKVVITTKVGGLPEIIRADRGMIVQPNDPDDLANAILSLIKNPDKLNSLSQNVTEYAKKLPSWNEVAAKFTQMIYSVYRSID